MKSDQMPPSRLFVMLAREAPVGVIFRRGPSEWTQIIKWNTDSDTFEYGAWFHGKIYPERCDISPDGTKLIYFAANFTQAQRNKDFPITWTAVSKLPWLTALSVWPNSSGTYFGGGVFDTNTKIWVNQNMWARNDLVAGFVLPEDMEISFEKQFWDHNWHDLFRLERNGWKPIEPYPWGSIPKFHLEQDYTVTVEPTDPNCPLHTPAYIRTAHEKPNTNGSHSLIMTSVYTHAGEDSRVFCLRDNHRHILTPIEGIVWADWDKRDRLVYAQDGKVFTGDTGRSGKMHAKELAEFNSSKPKRTISPAWAREW